MNEKRVLICRWGGMTQLDLKEVSSSNAASLDYFLVRKLVEMGYQVEVAGASRTFEKCVEENTSGWYHKIKLLDYYPTSTGNDYEAIFCSQGTENFRFGGYNGIPSQLWVYRLLRSCTETPFFYLQYDANTPLFLPSYSRGNICAVFGLTIKETIQSNINIVVVGRDMEKFKNLGYENSYDLVRFFNWKHDFHAVASAIVREMSLPINEEPDSCITFVGKDRRSGSKSDMLVNTALTFEENLPDFYVNIYGNWKHRYPDIDNPGVPNFKLNGTVKGLENVLSIYNKSEFSLLANNEFNLLIGQYTIRTFEVIAGGSIPILERNWFCKWKDIFTPEMAKFIDLNLCFENESEIPDIIKNFRKNHNRTKFIEEMRISLCTVLTEKYITSEMENLITQGKNYSPPEVNFKKVLHQMFIEDSTSKSAKRRASAEEDYKIKIGIENGSPEVISGFNDSIKEEWSFNYSPYTKEDLIKIFSRSLTN